MKIEIETIARVCHEANASLCRAFGDFTQQSWGDAAQWQRVSAINGVKWRLDNPTAPASAQHDAWLQDKVQAGWKYGPVKDPEKKEHPCLVPYHCLPASERAKDVLFGVVVQALRPLL